MVQSFGVAEDVATQDTKSFLQSLSAMGAWSWARRSSAA